MFVYAMRGGGFVKIGVSDDLERRLASFNQGALPFEMTIICYAEAPTELALSIEAEMLTVPPKRARGEWFSGEFSDDEVIALFTLWGARWQGQIQKHPSAEAIAASCYAVRENRARLVRREAANAMSGEPVRAGDWLKSATVAAESGDAAALRRIKRAFKAKRLVAQNRALR